MASISKEPNGRRTIQFVAADGKRRSIRLGKVSQRTAEGVKVHVENLATAAMTGHGLPDETAVWLTERDAVMLKKLSAVGLIPERATSALDSFLERYFARRNDVKPTTLGVWAQVRQSLVDFFGADRDLRDISIEQAEDWRAELNSRGLASTTVAKRLAFARHFFGVAKRYGLISENPFDDVKQAGVLPEERVRFVTRHEIEKVLKACPDAEWRLIVALARYGGLRVPSEVLTLKLNDVDWDQRKIKVTSPKTERKGKPSRIIPLYPELEPYLRDVRDAAAPGTVYFITKHRKPAGKREDGRECNYRQRFEKIILRAGVKPWPKIFQNLRSSRETELAQTYSIKAVTDWMGNTPSVALRHYLQTTDDDFRRASRECRQPGAKSGAREVQNAVQQPRADLRDVSHAQDASSDACDGLRDFAQVGSGKRVTTTEVHGNRTHRPHG